MSSAIARTPRRRAAVSRFLDIECEVSEEDEDDFDDNDEEEAEAEETEEEAEFEDIALPSSLTEPMTVVTETPLAISYSVHGKSTIPSDGIEHQVTVALLPFEAQISYVAVPRVEPCVYLQVCFARLRGGCGS